MTVITDFLFIVIGIVAGVVLLSCIILWYEAANRDPALLNGRLAPKKLWLTARLMTGEFLSLCLILATYPFGLSNRPDHPVSDRTGTPIIFLHGLFHNRAAWLLMKFRLRRLGLTDLYTLNLPSWKDIETLTERLAMLVDELRHQRGIDKVHLVGHSMGGVIARNYLQIRGGATKVERCILLGAPNYGSKMVPFAVTNLAKVLIPGSPFLAKLNAQPYPDGARLTNIYSRHDNMVIPYELAIIDSQTNIELSGVGHAALLYHPKAFHEIKTALTQTDAQP